MQENFFQIRAIKINFNNLKATAKIGCFDAAMP